jgi:hypothetical protein
MEKLKEVSAESVYLKLLIHFLLVRCEVLARVKIDIAVPSIMTLHGLVDVYQHLGYFVSTILSHALKWASTFL